MRTARATASRQATYDGRTKGALAPIKAARAAGAKNAGQLAVYLNSNQVHAPNNEQWTVSAVLRCLRRLKALGLDRGSLTPHEARSWGPYPPNANRALC